MMMPANFSAVNAEVVYGGAVADYLPAKWTSANVKTLSTNLVTILSNSFTSALVNVTLGTMFGGAWGDGADLFGDDGSVTGLFKYGINGYKTPATATEMNFFNKVMTGLGVSAAVYTLGTTPVKSYAGAQKVITVNTVADNF